MEQWPLIAADLHSEYGIDAGDPELFHIRSWTWLRLRILGLLSTESRLSRHFEPKKRGA